MKTYVHLMLFGLISLTLCSFQASGQEREKPKPAEKFELKKITPGKFDKAFPEIPKDFKYKKIKKFDAELDKISSQVEFKAGTIPELTFRLRNLAFKKLIIHEWMMNEPFNIKVYYTPWTKGMKKLPLDQWQVIEADVGENPKRMPLELKHRNSTLIKTTLPFVKELKIITPKDFLIVGELNLTSIPIKSRPVRIRINP